MLVRIIIEVVLAVAMIFAGHLFWQLCKRDAFLKRGISNPLLLESLISRERLSSVPQYLQMFTTISDSAYVIHIKSLLDTDRAVHRRVTLSFLLALGAIFTGSYFLGYVYLAINVGLFLLTSVEPLSLAAQNNAMEHILAIALILHKWRLDKPGDCDKWVAAALSFRPLYDAIKKVQ